MKTILVLNAKGGVGKTTIATNLAGYYAHKKKRTCLIEMDPQHSVLEWARSRPISDGRLNCIDGTTHPLNIPKNADYVIIDAPAAARGNPLVSLLRRADMIIIPVLPSPIDIKALKNYLGELRKAITHCGKKNKLKIGVVANRTRAHTNMSVQLHKYLSNFPYKYLAALRDSTNYINAAMLGRSIFEYREALHKSDRKDWKPIIEWIG